MAELAGALEFRVRDGNIRRPHLGERFKKYGYDIWLLGASMHIDS